MIGRARHTCIIVVVSCYGGSIQIELLKPQPHNHQTLHPLKEARATQILSIATLELYAEIVGCDLGFMVFGVLVQCVPATPVTYCVKAVPINQGVVITKLWVVRVTGMAARG